MADRPILFSAPMVRAILAGAKTQTRRVVKPRPIPAGGWTVAARPRGFELTHWDSDEQERRGIACPYGQPGDRLWVREAWARTTVGLGTTMVVYREGDNRTDYGGPWKPGIHMFRRDSRITLGVTGVRVERLQAISRGDAMAEGCPFANMASGPDPREWYRDLWNEINGHGSWDANPWVWVVEFRRVEQSNG